MSGDRVIDAPVRAPQGARMVRIQVALIALMLAACGTTEPTPPTADATPPERPAIPDGWVTIASDNGEAALTVPPNLRRFAMDTPAGVFVQAVLGDRSTPLQIWATGPSDLPDQPAGGESLRTWLERGGWFPAAEAAAADFSEREIALPAGRALELDATLQPATGDWSRVTAYAIETASGFAVLQIVGEPDDIQARADELRLIALLVRFGD